MATRGGRRQYLKQQREFVLAVRAEILLELIQGLFPQVVYSILKGEEEFKEENEEETSSF